MSALAATPAVIPFPYATGRGVRIAVIDSGVNPRHPHICARTHLVSALDREPDEDDLGHGTAVTAAIQEKAPGAEYFAVKLFTTGLRTTSERLLNALEWCVENRMDIVNLSLGTRNQGIRAALEALIDRAAAANTLLVSARNNGADPVLPGTLPGVFGVAVDWGFPRHDYRAVQFADEVYFSASGYPRPLPGRPQRRNLNGVSFAVANFTGILARACEGLQDRSFRSVRSVMIAGAPQP